MGRCSRSTLGAIQNRARSLPLAQRNIQFVHGALNGPMRKMHWGIAVMLQCKGSA